MQLKSRAELIADKYIHSLYETVFEHISTYIPHGSAVVVEVGSGTGIGAEFIHEMILTDLMFDASLDANCQSEYLPFRSNSVDVLVLKDSFHHIPNVDQFLREATRVLKDRGRAIIFDPYWGALAQLVYRFLHQEDFSTKTDPWTITSTSPWDSNQALSFLLLRRHRKEFGERFPELEPRELEVLIGPSFLLSGGVSRRTSISGRFLSHLLKWEMTQGRWFNPFRFFHIFSLTKKDVEVAT